MRQRRPGWTRRGWKVYMRRCNEGKYDAPVTQELLAEFRRASTADKRWAYRQANPEKVAAKEAVGRAVARGNLIRPPTCSRCGAECKPIGHHHSYEVEDRLVVEWLCPRCHSSVHGR